MSNGDIHRDPVLRRRSLRHVHSFFVELGPRFMVCARISHDHRRPRGTMLLSGEINASVGRRLFGSIAPGTINCVTAVTSAIGRGQYHVKGREREMDLSEERSRYHHINLFSCQISPGRVSQWDTRVQRLTRLWYYVVQIRRSFFLLQRSFLMVLSEITVFFHSPASCIMHSCS